ncbi:MAG TPA: hypothetical protein VMY37_38580 [Thermoguttaceae bacterium]|nr:hypothetical protein [Thermoguttaceae bacterium]
MNVSHTIEASGDGKIRMTMQHSTTWEAPLDEAEAAYAELGEAITEAKKAKRPKARYEEGQWFVRRDCPRLTRVIVGPAAWVVDHWLYPVGGWPWGRQMTAVEVNVDSGTYLPIPPRRDLPADSAFELTGEVRVAEKYEWFCGTVSCGVLQGPTKTTCSFDGRRWIARLKAAPVLTGAAWLDANATPENASKVFRFRDETYAIGFGGDLVRIYPLNGSRTYTYRLFGHGPAAWYCLPLCFADHAAELSDETVTWFELVPAGEGV